MKQPRTLQFTPRVVASGWTWLPNAYCVRITVCTDSTLFLPLNSRGGLVLFVLIQKGPKKSSQPQCFFAARGLCAANPTKPGLSRTCGILRMCRAVRRFCKSFLCPAARKAGIVLSDFARSCAADGRHFHLAIIARNEAISILCRSIRRIMFRTNTATAH